MRTTLTAPLSNSATQALKIGLYDSVNPAMLSYFYGEVGTFLLGVLEKSSWTQRDWFRFSSSRRALALIVAF